MGGRKRHTEKWLWQLFPGYTCPLGHGAEGDLICLWRIPSRNRPGFGAEKNGGRYGDEKMKVDKVRRHGWKN